MSDKFQSTYTLPEGSHSGSFNMRGGCDVLWDLKYEFREVNKDAPVCVIVPGHRSRGIESEGNAKVVDNVEAAGMSVLAFDYTGDQRTVKNVDPITMDSNIADTKAVLDLFGDRPHVMLARSYGFSVGLSAANDKTKGLIGALPVADLYESMYQPYFDRKPFYMKWGFEALMRTRGYYIWQPKQKDYTKVDFVKITRPFVKSLDEHKLPKIFERQSNRFPIHLIANDEDHVANVERTNNLAAELQAQGFEVKTEIVAGKSHELSEDSHEAVCRAIEAYTL